MSDLSEWEITLTDDPDLLARYAEQASAAFANVLLRLARDGEPGRGYLDAA
jgi:hypothetical protein